ncbi:uncharacterized protein LOC132196953 [Neocloeon triangulifer]|uniref:uncharacterized protein LOC132196953 n=1 Tax=Neocloeon triangulifer TaxID=2078957 RepID=UPI00286EF9D1|nr:uncharacterized protein LOC132196953 [Neocloeon triangulifer]
MFCCFRLVFNFLVIHVSVVLCFDATKRLLISQLDGSGIRKNIAVCFHFRYFCQFINEMNYYHMYGDEDPYDGADYLDFAQEADELQMNYDLVMDYLNEEDDYESNPEIDEEIRLQTSKLLFNSSLTNKCLNVLVEDLNTYSRSNNAMLITFKDSVANLPPTLKACLFKKLGHANHGYKGSEKMDPRVIYIIISHLLGPQTSEFNFVWMDPESDLDLVEKTYRFLASKCHNSLRRLIHGNEGKISRNSSYELSFNRLKSILYLKNLQHLQLHENALNDLDFRRICHKLVNLQYLSCELVDVAQDALANALMPLKKLEVFIFKAWTRNMKLKPLELVDSSKLNGFCLKNFPQLKVIGAQVGNEHFQAHDSRTTFHHLERRDLLSGKTRQLQHLSINKPLTNEQANKLPNVTSLRISVGTELALDIGNLVQFDKLRNLTVEWPTENSTYDKNVLIWLLQTYGPQIECLSLRIYPHHPELTLWEIHALCPKLEKLSLDHNFVRGLDQANLLDPSTINNLTKISITGWRERWGSEKLLYQLFTPPKLECLCLWDTQLSDDTVECAVETVNDGPQSISPSLKEFRGSANFSEEWMTVNGINRRSLAAYWGFFVEMICARAPALMIVKFDYGHSGADAPEGLVSMLERARIL